MKDVEVNLVFLTIERYSACKELSKSAKMPKLECATTADYVWVNVGTLE